MWLWRRYSGRVDGLLLKGDPKVPPTTWWNALFVRLYWNEVTILEVPDDIRDYRVGYIPFAGPTKYLTTVLHSPRFAVRHGRENCKFFAIMLDGTELPLKLATRTTVDELPNSVPLV